MPKTKRPESLMIQAVKNNDLKKVTALLKHTTSVNDTDRDGRTALWWAIHLKSGEISELLVANGGELERSWLQIETGQNTLAEVIKNRGVSDLNRCKLFILTGAGISAESGIPTFRSPNGLWNHPDSQRIATHSHFVKSRKSVINLHVKLKKLMKEKVPNQAHFALAALEQQWLGDLLVVTQNVDNLHFKAGSLKVPKLHGCLSEKRCEACGRVSQWTTEDLDSAPCSKCMRSTPHRPNTVLFGEESHQHEMALRAAAECELFIAIGTSGMVAPAFSLVGLASNAHKIEINTEETEVSGLFDEKIQGQAHIEVPKLMKLLGVRI